MKFYSNKFAVPVSANSDGLFRHPQIGGLLLREIRSPDQFDMIEGFMCFHPDTGEVLFGKYGTSYRNFKKNPKLYIHTRESTIGGISGYYVPAGYHGQAQNSQFNPSNGVFIGCTIGSFEAHGAEDGTDTQFHGVTIELDTWYSACGDTKRAPSRESTVISAPIMEIVAFNCDDGDFRVDASVGGFVQHPFGVGRQSSWVSKSSKAPVGWMSRMVTCGYMKHGMELAKPGMVHGMKSSERKYFDKGWNDVVGRMPHDRPVHAAIVTGFYYNEVDAMSTEATGISEPSVSAVVTYVNAIHPRSMMFTPNVIREEIFAMPMVVPCGDPNGMHIVSDVKTGHCLGRAIDPIDGKIHQIYADGMDLDDAVRMVGRMYSDGATEPSVVYEPFPEDADLTGLTEEEIARGWQRVVFETDAQAVAVNYKRATGVHMFPQFQETASSVYQRAISAAKKDAKKKRGF